MRTTSYFLLVLQTVAIIGLLLVTIVVTSQVTANNVNNHLDNVVQQSIQANKQNSEAAKRLFIQVNNICDALKAQNSEINCG